MVATSTTSDIYDLHDVENPQKVVVVEVFLNSCNIVLPISLLYCGVFFCFSKMFLKMLQTATASGKVKRICPGCGGELPVAKKDPAKENPLCKHCVKVGSLPAQGLFFRACKSDWFSLLSFSSR